MPANNEKFLQIVEEAEKISQTIKILQEEITSYKTAGKSLEEVKNALDNYLIAAKEASNSLVELTNTVADKLVDISSKTEKLEQDIAKVDTNMAEIDTGLKKRLENINEHLNIMAQNNIQELKQASGGILNGMQETALSLTSKSEDIIENINLSNQKLEEGLPTIHKHMKSLADEKLLEVANKLNFLKTLIYISIGVAVASLVIGLII